MTATLLLDPDHLPRLRRDLLAARDDVTAGVADVPPAPPGHPWADLVDRAVADLLRRAESVARACAQLDQDLGELADELTRADVVAADRGAGR